MTMAKQMSEPSEEDLRFLRRFPDKCCAEVSRQGETQPCDKTAVAVAVGDADGVDDLHWWPVCAFHTRGRAMVSLSDLLKHLVS